MIRRLLVVAAIVWVGRWAVLFVASELERRRRFPEGGHEGRPPLC
jgi:hypothetical protein